MIAYLQVENLTKFYGEQVLFSDISFGINKDQKVAIIAKNGAGKTSLLNIITNGDTPDSGSVTFRRDLSIGYLPQVPHFDENMTVIEYVFNTSSEIVLAVKEYEASLQTNDKQRLEEASHRMDTLQAWDFETRIKQILTQLKITNFNQPLGQLSGGQRKRVAMANVLINDPDFLILDEPTNHLDLEMIEWLEEYIRKSRCTLLMVTHDRYFLDRVCNEIIELDDNNIYSYSGNYTYFVEKRAERIQLLSTNIQKANNLMRKELDWIRRMPKARGTKAKYRIDSFYKTKEIASQRINDQKIELDIQSRRLGSKTIEVYNLSKKFGNLIITNDFTYKFARFEKIGIAGKNGTGKTTFLNLITGALPADSGHVEIGETVHIGYYRQENMQLNENMRMIDVIKEISEDISLGDGRKLSPLQFLEMFLFPAQMHYNYVSKLSGGEKRRLYLMTVLMQNPNFLILDEPTNDLDIMTLNVLEEYLRNFQGCLIIVSHDRYFMDKVVDNMFVFEGNGEIFNFPGNYTEFREYELEQEKEKRKQERDEKPQKEKTQKNNSTNKRMSFKEKREFETLQTEIEILTKEKAELETAISSGNLKQDILIEKADRLGQIIELIDEKEMRWLELSEIE